MHTVELALNFGARYWLLIGAALVIALVIVPCMWREHKSNQLQRQLEGARLRPGIRGPFAPSYNGRDAGVLIDAGLFDLIRDDCLRRGYPLHNANWISQRACELGGALEHIEQAEGQLHHEKGGIPNG